MNEPTGGPEDLLIFELFGELVRVPWPFNSFGQEVHDTVTKKGMLLRMKAANDLGEEGFFTGRLYENNERSFKVGYTQVVFLPELPSELEVGTLATWGNLEKTTCANFFGFGAEEVTFFDNAPYFTPSSLIEKMRGDGTGAGTEIINLYSRKPNFSDEFWINYIFNNGGMTTCEFNVARDALPELCPLLGIDESDFEASPVVGDLLYAQPEGISLTQQEVVPLLGKLLVREEEKALSR